MNETVMEIDNEHRLKLCKANLGLDNEPYHLRLEVKKKVLWFEFWLSAWESNDFWYPKLNEKLDQFFSRVIELSKLPERLTFLQQ